MACTDGAEDDWEKIERDFPKNVDKLSCESRDDSINAIYRHFAIPTNGRLGEDFVLRKLV